MAALRFVEGLVGAEDWRSVITWSRDHRSKTLSPKSATTWNVLSLYIAEFTYSREMSQNVQHQLSLRDGVHEPSWVSHDSRSCTCSLVSQITNHGTDGLKVVEAFRAFDEVSVKCFESELDAGYKESIAKFGIA